MSLAVIYQESMEFDECSLKTLNIGFPAIVFSLKTQLLEKRWKYRQTWFYSQNRDA